MQVILLEKIRNLGNLGDTVNVKPGYARNFLMPQGKATPATSENLEKFQARRAELEKAEKEALTKAQNRAKKIEEQGTITIHAKAGDEGKLFGSVGARDVAAALNKIGGDIEKSEIIMPQGAIRLVGEYEVFVQFHSDLRVPVKINIVPGEA